MSTGQITSDWLPSICFVAHNAYGALSGELTNHVGGIERQQALMARWFAARGWRVGMITWDESQPEDCVVDGVRVYKMCRPDSGVRRMRFVYPRWTSLWRAMGRANADVYYYNCGDVGLGQVVLWCRLHGRKSTYSVASDPDCDPRLPVLSALRERILYRYGLHHADRVVCQTRRQQDMLRRGFGVASVPIPMPCALENAHSGHFARPPDGRTPRILWVGRFSSEKRLEWLLDLAEKRPTWEFDVVGAANGTSAYALDLLRRAQTLPNVTLHGRVPHSEMASFYGNSTALCCTSAYEGFPNGFLEAWSLRLPVVSTFDPDDVIATYHCGAVADSVDQLAFELEALFTSPQGWHRASDAGHEYYLNNHTLEGSMVRFGQVLVELGTEAQRTAHNHVGAAPSRTVTQGAEV